MTDASEEHRPNDYGFSGGATAPEPARGSEREEVDGEAIAVPSGDLTGAVSHAIEDATTGDDEER
ncbi:hypothetical protein [Pseudosporangium ferrugineum]|uniref:Uncharacterized protein n=1 Tax=Pseudosporangium ferrugineum TaxID=439699 RepID=A0A2T0S4N8_9ACTN|nr:hypothetical protein [Pseudosporangium ferrugineum]PRY28388.1 hypothetical protein CLV70_108180 [Pseudosporangium ferrugineum]